MTLSTGSITDSSGSISFGDENLSTTGTINAETGSNIGNLTLADGSITDSGGSISFGDENLSTTGTLNAGVTNLASTSTIGNLTFLQMDRSPILMDPFLLEMKIYQQQGTITLELQQWGLVLQLAT